MQVLVRPELPTASVGPSQATTAAVDNSVPLATRPQSTYKSGNVVQTSGATSEDLGFNKQPVIMQLSATKLGNCSIVDKSNFRCDGLERRDGNFVNTASIGWRRLSSSKGCAGVAKYWGNGWVDDANLDLHDHDWIVIVYIVGAVIVGAGLLGALGL